MSACGTIVDHHGGFADKVRADSNSVVKIPQGISLEEAGPLFCGGITVFNPMVQYDLPPTSKVAVQQTLSGFDGSFYRFNFTEGGAEGWMV